MSEETPQTKLDEAKEELKKFHYAEKSLLTEEELDTLKEMFKIPGSFNALFRHLCVIESENGTQMAYEIELLPTGGHIPDEEIARTARLNKTITSHVKGRVEALRNRFAVDAQAKVTEAEREVAEEKRVNEEKAKEKVRLAEEKAKAKAIADAKKKEERRVAKLDMSESM